MSAEISRRRFVGLATLAGVGVATVGLSVCTAPVYPLIAAMGDEYLQRHPDEASQAVLGPLLGNPDHPSHWPGTLLRANASRIDADYASGNTEVITGWVLSRTEWRITAFWALRPDRPA